MFTKGQTLWRVDWHTQTLESAEFVSRNHSWMTLRSGDREWKVNGQGNWYSSKEQAAWSNLFAVAPPFWGDKRSRVEIAEMMQAASSMYLKVAGERVEMEAP